MACCLSSCYTHDPPPVTKSASISPAAILLKRIGTTGQVSFKSRNGNLLGLDNDFILHFYANSKVEFQRMSIGVDHFKGTSYITPNGRVEVSIIGLYEPWPPMILRLDGADLLLYREDGHTSSLPKDYPYPVVGQPDALWPFRATNETAAQQAAPSNR
jgi:hypothetical protein